jgi:hypothetical protein
MNDLCSQQGRNGNNAEKVKFSTSKNAGHAAGDTPIDIILWTLETELDSAGILPKVSRVLGLMAQGANHSNWKETFRTVTRDIDDPNVIRNWTWDRFCKKLPKSSMYSPPNKKKLLDAFLNVKCRDPDNSDQITARMITRFCSLCKTFDSIALICHSMSPSSEQAQPYYKNLTPLVRRHMALRDPKRKDPEIRDFWRRLGRRASGSA